MKYLILLSCLLFSCLFFGQKNTSEIIMYEVPISPFASTEFQVQSYNEKEKSLDDYITHYRQSSLTVTNREYFLDIVFNRLRTGEITAYLADQNREILHPSELFKTPVPHEYFTKDLIFNSISENMASQLYEVYYVAELDEYGETSYDDETGEQYMGTYYTQYENRDFISLTFYEEWNLNDDDHQLYKKVIGYSLNVTKNDPETGYSMGSKPLFYIPCTLSDKQIKFANNIKTKTQIVTPSEDIKLKWWENNLTQSFRYNLLNPILNQHDTKYVTEYPYQQILTTKDIADSNSIRYNVIAYDDYGDPIYDELTGENVYDTDIVVIDYTFIKNIEFVEDWYIDTNTLSITKDVKGMIPYKTYETWDDADNVFVKTTPMYLHKFENKSFEKEISGTSCNDLRMSIFFNNTKSQNNEYFSIFEVDSLHQNVIELDTTVMNKIKHSYFSGNNLSFYEYRWEINGFTKVHDSLLNKLNAEEFWIEQRDENDEPLYDPEFGDPIYQLILTPYTEQDVKGWDFIENWQYDYDQNKFNKQIIYSGSFTWAINPETGDIQGRKALLYTKQSENDNFQLIKNNIVYRHRLFDYSHEFTINYQKYTSNIYPAEREKLLLALLDNIKSKKAKAIDPATGKKIKPEDVEEYSKGVSFADVETIVFDEDWYYNFETLNFKKKVNSITLFRTEKINGKQVESPWIKITMNTK